MPSIIPGSNASQASLRDALRILLTGVGGPDDGFIERLADALFDLFIEALRATDLGTTNELRLIFADVRERLVDDLRKKLRGVVGVADATEAFASAVENGELP